MLNKLDSRKILPSSESISTLDIEASRDGYVSALALLDRTDGAQLYIGTSRGAVIVAQAFEVSSFLLLVISALIMCIYT